jgi:hypothetical protein
VTTADAFFAILLATLVLACRAFGADFNGLPVVGQTANGYVLCDPRPGLAQRGYQNGKAKATYAHYQTTAKLVPLTARTGYPKWVWEKHWKADSLTFFGPIKVAMAAAMYLDGGKWLVVKSGATREGEHNHVFYAGNNISCGGAVWTNWASPWPRTKPTVLFFYTDTQVSQAVVLNPSEPPTPDPTHQLISGEWTLDGARLDAAMRNGTIFRINSYTLEIK